MLWLEVQRKSSMSVKWLLSCTDALNKNVVGL